MNINSKEKIVGWHATLVYNTEKFLLLFQSINQLVKTLQRINKKGTGLNDL